MAWVLTSQSTPALWKHWDSRWHWSPRNRSHQTPTAAGRTWIHTKHINWKCSKYHWSKWPTAISRTEQDTICARHGISIANQILKWNWSMCIPFLVWRTEEWASNYVPATDLANQTMHWSRTGEKRRVALWTRHLQGECLVSIDRFP